MRRRQVLTGLVGVTGGALLEASTADAQSVSAQALRSALAAARSLFHACRYSDLGRALPDLIITAQVSRDTAIGGQHETLSALLADAYSLASNLCTRLHDDALAWVTADRARFAAQVSGSPSSLAEAARMASIAMRRHGHHDNAITLLTNTALSLGDNTGSPQTRASGHLRVAAVHRVLHRRPPRQP